MSRRTIQKADRARRKLWSSAPIPEITSGRHQRDVPVVQGRKVLRCVPRKIARSDLTRPRSGEECIRQGFCLLHESWNSNQ